MTDKAKPNGWFHDGDWRHLFEHDTPMARYLRQALDKLNLYPATVFKGHSRNDVHEANHRALLHTLADELPHDDVLALTKAGRLLRLVEREKDPVE